MKDYNYDPFKEMVEIAKSLDTPRRDRMTLAMDLAQYIAPKLKGIDIDARASGSISVIVQRFAEEVAQEALADEPKTIQLENSDEETSTEDGQKENP